MRGFQAGYFFKEAGPKDYEVFRKSLDPRYFKQLQMAQSLYGADPDGESFKYLSNLATASREAQEKAMKANPQHGIQFINQLQTGKPPKFGRWDLKAKTLWNTLRGTIANEMSKGLKQNPEQLSKTFNLGKAQNAGK